MFKELETIVLTHSIKNSELKKGDMGTIVHVYGDGKAFEVEFVTANGNTVAVLTLEPKDIRKSEKNEILHAREINPNIATP